MEVEKHFEYKEEDITTTSGTSEEEHNHRPEENALHMETQGTDSDRFWD